MDQKKNNLKYTYALELLEDVLSLEQELRSSLKWNCIGFLKNNFYLISLNVGDPKKIVANRVSSKIEENIVVVTRETMIQRLSEQEKPEKKIRIAALQHLYLRFLLDIGDSGAHNILIRKDSQKSKRLIVGNDLEEKRKSRKYTRRLECLFRKQPSKLEVSLYSDLVANIHAITQLDEKVTKALLDIGIDVEKLKKNIELWKSLKK